MAGIWKCEICLLFSALTLKQLVRHISVEHAAMPNFKVKCGVEGCPDEYKRMNSFRKHLRTCHAHEYSENFQPEEQPGNEDPGPVESNSARENDDVGNYDDQDDNDDEAFNPVCMYF